MKASTLEKINGRMAREISALKRSVHKAEQAASKSREQAAEWEKRYQEVSDEVGELYSKLVLAGSDINHLKQELQCERTVWNRIGKTIASLLNNWVARKKTRIWNWFLVKRLNKPRVEAMSEAGYIPAKLIKLANAYWEHDQKRLQEDEEIIKSSYSVCGNEHTEQRIYSRKPGLIRRLKIWMGRA